MCDHLRRSWQPDADVVAAGAVGRRSLPWCATPSGAGERRRRTARATSPTTACLVTEVEILDVVIEDGIIAGDDAHGAAGVRHPNIGDRRAGGGRLPGGSQNARGRSSRRRTGEREAQLAEFIRKLAHEAAGRAAGARAEAARADRLGGSARADRPARSWSGRRRRARLEVRAKRSASAAQAMHHEGDT